MSSSSSSSSFPPCCSVSFSLGFVIFFFFFFFLSMLQAGSPFLFCAGRSSLRSGNNSMAGDVPPASAQSPAFCPNVFGTRGRTLKACPEGEGRQGGGALPLFTSCREG